MSHPLVKWQQGLVLVVDSTLVCVSLIACWFLRYELAFPHRRILLAAIPVLVAARIAAMYRYRVAHPISQYMGPGDVKDLAKAVALSSAAFFVVVRVVLGMRAFPYSVYFFEALLFLLLFIALRTAVHSIVQRRATRKLGDPVPVLIVGGGAGGTLLLQAMKQTQYVAVGFVDDDPSKQKLKIGGVSVLGRVEDLPVLARKHEAKQILIAIPSATGTQMFHITDACRRAGLSFRAVPSLASLVGGSRQIAELQDVKLDDLLGRDPVPAESNWEHSALRGRVVMVTGAAGSIGAELCTQILRCHPAKLICLDQAETPLFHLQKKLHAHSEVETAFVVADITDHQSIRHHLLRYGVDAIFHAAAYKHVPLSETNSYEALKNNVFGLLDLLECAEKCGCDDFVLISTDKAVKPSSVMGCTKRLGELIVGSKPFSRMRCVSVRFGNVLGSQGSVVPIFQEQIRSGAPITVTHPQMTRYFMTIPEAAYLVVQAFTVGNHGDILVLDMGKAVHIVDLAKTLIRILGKSEDEVTIQYTGMRPGEKLHEELFYDTETPEPTSVVKVKYAKCCPPAWSQLSRQLRELRECSIAQNSDQIREKFRQIIPEYEWVPSQKQEHVKVPAFSIIDGLSAQERTALPVYLRKPVLVEDRESA